MARAGTGRRRHRVERRQRRAGNVHGEAADEIGAEIDHISEPVVKQHLMRMRRILAVAVRAASGKHQPRAGAGEAAIARGAARC